MSKQILYELSYMNISKNRINKKMSDCQKHSPNSQKIYIHQISITKKIDYLCLLQKTPL